MSTARLPTLIWARTYIDRPRVAAADQIYSTRPAVPASTVVTFYSTGHRKPHVDGTHGPAGLRNTPALRASRPAKAVST